MVYYDYDYVKEPTGIAFYTRLLNYENVRRKRCIAESQPRLL